MTIGNITSQQHVEIENFFRIALGDAVAVRNLTVFRGRLIGSRFTFAKTYGSHHHIIEGTIIGCATSDEGGFHIFVSVSEFMGRRLRSICFNGNEFYALVERQHDSDDQCISGIFEANL